MPAIAKNLARPDDTVSFPNGRGDIVQLEGMIVGRGVLQPGWKWSNDVKPIAGTTSCEIHHVGYLLAGQLHIELNDGSVIDLKEGDVYDVPSGHDDGAVGDSLVGTLDWSGNTGTYARPAQ
jgi:hypothetical protein